MPSIFISYRRSDSQDVAGRIYDRLAQHFGREAIFKDVDDIPGGEDFRIFLQNTLQQCKVLLAIIGPDWVNALDGQGRRRLDNPADWVRMEIEESLSRDDVLVLPVLVSNAAMPRMDELPDGMKNLVYRNYRLARPDPDFHKDVGRLIIDLERHVEQTRPPAPPVVTKINTSQQRLDNYRDLVRQYLKADNGELTPVSRGILNGLRNHFGLTQTEAEAVEAEEQQPYLQKAEAIANYRKVFAYTLQYEYPPSEGTRQRLRDFQQLLELTDHDVQGIEAPLLQQARKEAERQRQEAEAARQQKEAAERERRQAAEAERQRQAAQNAARQREAEAKKQQEVEGLSSERFGANYYAKLRDLLAAQDWKAADEETARCMCEVMDRQKERWLRIEEIEQFPCLDLKNIDRLWVTHSNGRFGFSVQKQIWQDCGSPTTAYDDDWERFVIAVGWRTKGGLLKKSEWLSYSQLTFALDAPKGHLPALLGGVVFGCSWRFMAGDVVMRCLFSRVQTCEV